MELATTHSGNIALARRLFQYFLDGKLESWLEMLDPNVDSHPSVDGRPELHGRDAVAQWWSHYASRVGEIEARTLDFEANGDCVIVRGYLRQREGRVLSEHQTFWLFEFRDGLVVRMESHPTRNAALAACSSADARPAPR